MVRWHLALVGLLAVTCRENRPTADRMSAAPADSAMLTEPMRADSMLDTMPAGEMVRGSPAAAARLLETKLR